MNFAPKLVFVFLLTVSLGHAGSPPEWMAALDSDAASVEEKARACQRLGEAGSEEAVPALAKLLADPALNTFARAALERIPGESPNKVLREALHSIRGTERIGVIQSLAARGDVEAVEELVALLDDDDEATAIAASHALGRMATDDAIRPLLSRLEEGPAARRAAAATAYLLSAEVQFEKGNSALARLVYEAVVSKGPPSFRAPAMRQLLLMADDPSLFIEKLRSPDEEIREVALLTLRDRPSESLADALHEELQLTDDPERKSLLIRAIRDCPNDRSVAMLARILTDAEGAVRLALIDALAHLGGEKAASALLGISDDPAAHQALITMKGAEADTVTAAALETADVSRRLALIEILGQRRSQQSLEALLVQAEDPHPEIRTAALRALRPLVGLDQVPVLITYYKTSEGDAKSAAFGALVSACRRSDSTDEAGKLIFAELENAADAAERQPWARILIDLGEASALPILAQDLQDPAEETVHETIEMLGRWPGAAPVEMLFPLCRKPAFKAEALRAILTLLAAEADPEKRLQWLTQIDPFIETQAEKRAYVAALAGTAHSGSRELLRPYLDDEEVRAEARAGLDTLEKSLE